MYTLIDAVFLIAVYKNNKKKISKDTININNCDTNKQLSTETVQENENDTKQDDTSRTYYLGEDETFQISCKIPECKDSEDFILEFTELTQTITNKGVIVNGLVKKTSITEKPIHINDCITNIALKHDKDEFLQYSIIKDYEKKN